MNLNLAWHVLTASSSCVQTMTVTLQALSFVKRDKSVASFSKLASPSWSCSPSALPQQVQAIKLEYGRFWNGRFGKEEHVQKFRCITEQ